MATFDAKWEDRDFWVTQDGRELKPADMEDNHIIKVIGMLERKAHGLKWAADLRLALMPGPQGDMASLAFEMEQINQFDMPDLVWLRETHIYKLLSQEAANRCLVVSQ